MDYLWTPWRYQYIATADREEGSCVFCQAAAAGDDERMLIVHRGRKNFIILNRYPYTSGHVMIVPYAHQGTLPALEPSAAAEMMEMAQTIERALESLYHPQGYNLGMNIGRAAGAGIAGHLHMHVLPRWTGDTSFITAVGETRIQPEELSVTYQRLRQALESQNGGALAVNFSLSPEQELLRQSVREFAEAEVKPLARELDRTGRFPREILRKAAELGFIGVSVPEEDGGAGSDHVSYSILIEEISRACASTGVILSVQNSLFCDPLHRFGTADQKRRFLAPYVNGDKLGCYALTEPQAGSNAAALRTIAVRSGDSYIVNGTKAWITCGGVADAALVYVNTDPTQKEKGITALLIERSTPGFGVGKEEEKLGIHATACTELSFTDCQVPVENRLGAEGEGYKIALATLDGGRIGIASQAIGIAQGAFEQALAYSKERQAFGHPISKFQAIQFMLADMATDIDAARMLARYAAWKHDNGVRFSQDASIAKLFASEMATRVTHKAIQIHGGNGYSREYPVERMYRDARITEIYEGTSEIQRLVISSWVLRES